MQAAILCRSMLIHKARRNLCRDKAAVDDIGVIMDGSRARRENKIMLALGRPQFPFPQLVYDLGR